LKITHIRIRTWSQIMIISTISYLEEN